MKKILEGVRRVGFWRPGKDCPEDNPLSACLTVLFRHLGSEASLGCHARNPGDKELPIPCGHFYLMGLTGEAFAVSYNPEEWDYGFCDSRRFLDDPYGPVKRGARAFGWSCEILESENCEETQCRERIVDSIERGIPVLAIGVIGPPEYCIITGYDADGEVLVGWNFFQGEEKDLETEENGMFRKAGWFEDTIALVFLKKSAPEPPLLENLNHILEYAVEILESHQTGEKYIAGLDAYDGWASELRKEENFPSGNKHVLKENFEEHHHSVGYLAENRHYAGRCLEMVIPYFPDVSSLLQMAIGRFRRIHDLMWRIWEVNVTGPQDRDGPMESPQPC